MTTPDQFIRIRTKKLGVLLYDARLSARRTEEECARAMGVTPERYREYEAGQHALSLPELEAFAYFLDIPLEHFWGGESLLEKPMNETPAQSERLLVLRRRMIGAGLRIARIKVNLSVKELCDRTSVSEANIRSYELGEINIPIPELELMCRHLDAPIESFFDERGPIGNWRNQQQAVQKFLDLPPELQKFVCKPVNRPYLELATRLSELSVEKLRSVAEGLLEITY